MTGPAQGRRSTPPQVLITVGVLELLAGVFSTLSWLVSPPGSRGVFTAVAAVLLTIGGLWFLVSGLRARHRSRLPDQPAR